MKQVFAVVFVCVLGTGAGAQDAVAAAEPEGSAAVMTVVEAADDTGEPPAVPLFAAGDVALEEFLWIARPIVVLADTPADPRFRQQMEYLASRPEGLIDRDVVVIIDTDPKARTSIRTKLRPRGFMLVLIDKDGTVNLRKPFPWDVREIEHAIDKWPLRQQEMRDAKRLGG